uniref:Serpin domain-containing protein n=2 Tax=Clastoptera arizonana TaxID=38151 RepID=A0A1B6DXX3_9HEMI
MVLLYFIGIILFVTSIMESTELTETQNEILDSVLKGSTNFAIDLYNVLKNEPGNLFFSPISLQLVLALAYSGAKASTAEEISKALLLPQKLEDVLEGYSLLLKLFDDPSLSVANKMFIEESFKLLPEFQASADKFFKAPADLVTFIKNSEGARNYINQWVEEKTKNKIKELLSKGVVSKETKLVLVNAIHFKADWSVKFLEKDTKKKTFYISKNESVETDMMHMTKKLDFLHDKELQFKALKLKYAESDLAMLILLPDAIDGLADLESKLSLIDFTEKFKHFSRPEVEVQLPKFKLETSMQLNDVLKQMGITTMFSKDANFSGISTQSDLVVSDVIQKAFVEVNEKGTEAAAATGMMFCTMSMVSPTPMTEKFICNHPFLFIIFNDGDCLVSFFIGRFFSVKN